MLSLDSFIVNIKTEGIYVDITKDVETRFDIINYELERPLPRAKKQKWNWNDKRSTRQKNTNINIAIKQIIVTKIKKQNAQKMCHKTKT